jgi:hypothetical protein
MAMRQGLVVTMADGAEHEVEVDGRDVRAWEEEFDSSALASPPSVTQMTFFAWHAGRRVGLWTTAWGLFKNECVDVRSGGSGPARPTRKARGAASS